MNTQEQIKAIESAIQLRKRVSRMTAEQRQTAVKRAAIKRRRFKGTATSSFLPSSDTPCKLSGIKYNGNPLSCMA